MLTLKKLFSPEVHDICPNCGTVCAITDALCPKCGKNLDELFEQLPDPEDSPFPLMKFIKRLVVILIGILIIGGAFCSISYFKYKKTYLDPYNQFRAMELQALPQFDKLNEKTYQELPTPPTSFKFSQKTTYGIDDPWHIGRWMAISYISLENDEDKFFKYYGTHLLNNSWVLLEEKDDGQTQEALYYKETSCISLSTSSASPGMYFIGIWQDFESQPFIGDIPSSDILGSNLYDSWSIAKCP